MLIEQSTSQRYVIAGGSGFLGVSLASHLIDLGHAVTILSRKPPRTTGPWQYISWDARTLGSWQETLDGADGLVNLVGRSVDCIKTPNHQDEILRSRVEATLVLGEALLQCSAPPPVWVQMSTAHIYGDPPSIVCTEESPPGYGLAPFVAQAWENAYRSAVLESQRQVILRTSFVIGRDRGAGGGALARLLRLARWGLGGTVGTGTQGMSWIHEADLNRIFTQGLMDSAMSGIYIASGPQPVSQRDFMRELRRAVGMPFGLPAAEWMVRLGAPWLMNTDPELALYGRYVIPQRLQSAGFTFEFPELGPALRNLLR